MDFPIQTMQVSSAFKILSVKGKHHHQVIAVMKLMNLKGQFEGTRYDSDSDSDGEELGHVGDDDQDENESMQEYNNINFQDWVIHNLKWQDIKLELASESLNDMKYLLKKSVKTLKREAKTRRACQHFASNPPCDDSRNLAIYLNEQFFSVILGIINKNESLLHCSIFTTIDDLELFTRASFVRCYYGHSPTTLWDDQDGFPHFAEAITNLGGIMKFKHIISCLKSPKAHDGTTWDNYFASCKDFDYLKQIFSKNCSCMLNHPSIQNVKANDDKLKFCLLEWEKVGAPRREGLKSFGPVFNILCHNVCIISVQ